MILKSMDTILSSSDSDNPIDRGIEGEQQVAFYLKQEFVDDQDILVIHDLRLRNGNDNYAQTDHIVIDVRRRLIWSAETKNFNGTLRCNRHGDWEVDYQRLVHQIESPTEQARRHATSLRRFLDGRGFTGFEVQPIVLLHPKMKIDRSGMDGDISVIKADNFVATIRKRQAQVLEAKSLTKEERLRLGSELLKSHQPRSFNRQQHKTMSIGKSNVINIGGSHRGRSYQRSRHQEKSPREILAAALVGILLISAIPAVIIMSLNGLAAGIKNKQAASSSVVATGQLVIIDQTGTPSQKQITAISLASGKTANISVKPGETQALRLKPGIYRIEGRSSGYHVNFGTVMIQEGQMASVRMGDPNQFMKVIQSR